MITAHSVSAKTKEWLIDLHCSQLLTDSDSNYYCLLDGQGSGMVKWVSQCLSSLLKISLIEVFKQFEEGFSQFNSTDVQTFNLSATDKVF